ncbi:hypothetical protein [Pseudokineococcus marinus]|uniref:Uncharacterized protein n=1 Tax=Pseudokineococcus marinus TaxID=351215 RepID=A0A849BTM5_9ACTN|nr:hypothetical protein [Pseudokineococcus marinus]NNH22876.1 hypothetical protein [Pseudokineococcus marinus]
MDCCAHRPWTAATVALLAGLSATACAQPPAAPQGLLQPSDLQQLEVVDAQVETPIGSVTRCEAVRDPHRELLGDGDFYRYDVKTDDDLAGTVWTGAYRPDADDVDTLWDYLPTTPTECPDIRRVEADRAMAAGAAEAAGLDPIDVQVYNASGYGTRAYALVDDRVVVVATSHDLTLDVDLPQLVATAVERSSGT